MTDDDKAIIEKHIQEVIERTLKEHGPEGPPFQPIERSSLSYDRVRQAADYTVYNNIVETAPFYGIDGSRSLPESVVNVVPDLEQRPFDGIEPAALSYKRENIITVPQPFEVLPFQPIESGMSDEDCRKLRLMSPCWFCFDDVERHRVIAVELTRGLDDPERIDLRPFQSDIEGMTGDEIKKFLGLTLRDGQLWRSNAIKTN